MGMLLTGAVPAMAMQVGIRDGYLAGLDADSVWAAAEKVGVKRLEVEVSPEFECRNLFEGDDRPYRIDTAENRRKLVEAARKHGCEIVAFCAVVRIVKDTPDEPQAEWLAKVAEAAADMNVPIIMVPLGARQIEEEEYVRRASAFVKRMGEIARATKVQLTVENLGTILNKREVLKPLMELVPDDEVGLALDITNMYWYGYPLDTIYELAELYAPHVRFFHAKNIKYPAEVRNEQRTPGWRYVEFAEPIPTGDIDFARIIEILARAGFDGDVIIEDDSLPKFDAAGKTRTIREGASFLREIIVEKTPATQPTDRSENGRPRVRFETSLGEFVLELRPDKAPETVANFLRYVDDGFYSGTVFHRIIDTFMIQGGGFTDLTTPKSTGLHPPIKNEAQQGLKNERGTIAMARTGEPHSATSQFFINVQDNANLDHPSFDGWGYCAFGTVVEGMDVVDRIRNVPTRPNRQMPGERSEPVDPPVIVGAQRVN